MKESKEQKETKAAKYRVELSGDHERELKMSAACAGISVPDYVERVLRPATQSDLRRRLQADAAWATIIKP